MNEKPIREYDRFILRLPDGMRESLRQRAEANQRSMNSEAVALLEKGLNSGDALSAKMLEQEIRRIQAEIDAAARQLNLLSDHRNRLRDALSVAKGPVEWPPEGTVVFYDKPKSSG